MAGENRPNENADEQVPVIENQRTAAEETQAAPSDALKAAAETAETVAAAASTADSPKSEDSDATAEVQPDAGVAEAEDTEASVEAEVDSGETPEPVAAETELEDSEGPVEVEAEPEESEEPVEAEAEPEQVLQPVEAETELELELEPVEAEAEEAPEPAEAEAEPEEEQEPVEAEAEPEVEPEPVEAEVEPEAAPEPVEAEVEFEEAPEPVEAETEPEVEPGPVEAEAEPEVEPEPVEAEAACAEEDQEAVASSDDTPVQDVSTDAAPPVDLEPDAVAAHADAGLYEEDAIQTMTSSAVPELAQSTPDAIEPAVEEDDEDDLISAVDPSGSAEDSIPLFDTSDSADDFDDDIGGDFETEPEVILDGPVVKDHVAIIGISARLPGAQDYHQFWDNLKNGVNSIREITPDRWDLDKYYSPVFDEPNKSVSKWCGLIDDIDMFDTRFFNISPREAKNMDPQQRLLMEETWRCIEDSGVALSELSEKTTSVYVGVMASDYHQEAASSDVETDSYAALGNYDCILANRISYFFGFNGPSLSIDAACAASLVALHKGRIGLETGEADYALAAGVSLDFHPWKYISFSKSRMLSPDGQCKTFDKDANGYVPGEGIGVVLMQPLQKARESGCHIYGIVKGSAVNHTGTGQSITAPRVSSQIEVIENAYKHADFKPDTVTYTEAHGTGTSLGDPIEIEALNQYFQRYTDELHYCDIGSAKTNIGHLEASAGVAGLLKLLMMMQHRQIPPSINLKTLNPIINFANSPLKVVRELKDWHPKEPHLPLRAGVSSFGFGGVNSHAVVEEYRPTDEDNKVPAGDAYEGTLFLLSAKTKKSLGLLMDKWQHFVETDAFKKASLNDIASTLMIGREPFKFRFGKYIKSKDDIREALADPNAIIGEEKSADWALRVGPVEIGGYAQIEGMTKNNPIFRRHLAGLLDLYMSLGIHEDGRDRFKLDIWSDEDDELFSFLVGVAYANTMDDLGFRLAMVTCEKKGLWVALAVSGILQASDVIYALTQRKPLSQMTLHRPNMPFYDPVNKRTLVAFRFDEVYLYSITDHIMLDKEIYFFYVEKARLLYRNQFTFKRYLDEWDVILKQYGKDLIQVIETDEPDSGDELTNQQLLLMVIIKSSLNKLNQKWVLTEAQHIKDHRLVELVEMVVDGVMPKEAMAELFLNDEPDLTGISLLLNKRQDKMGPNSKYDFLHSQNQILTEIPDFPAWVKVAETIRTTRFAAENLVYLDVGAVSENATPAPLVRVTSGDAAHRDVQETLLELWRNGVKPDWSVLHPNGSFNKLALPTYEFDRGSFWLAKTEVEDVRQVEMARLSDERFIELLDLFVAGVLPREVLLDTFKADNPELSAMNTLDFYRRKSTEVGLSSTLESRLEVIDNARRHFRRTFSGADAIAGDHVITGRAIVPGAAFIENALEAIGVALSEPVLQLRNVTIKAPAVLAPDVTVDTKVIPDSKQFQLVGPAGVLCDGHYELGIEKSNAKLDVKRLRNVAPIDSSSLYNMLARNGYAYGPGLQMIKRVWNRKNRYLMELETSIGDEGSVTGVSPALLDGFFQGVLGVLCISGKFPGNGQLFVPYSIKGMTLYGKVKGLSYLSLGKADIHALGSDLHIRFRGFNNNGRMVMQVDGMVYKRVPNRFLDMAAPRAVAPAPGGQAYFFAPGWVQRGVPMGHRDYTSKTAIIFGGSAHSESGLRQKLANNYSRVISVEKGPEFSASGDKVRLDPTSLDHYSSLFRDLIKPGLNLDLYFLWAYEEAALAPDTVDKVRAAQDNGLRCLFNLTKALMALRVKDVVHVMIALNRAFTVDAGDKGEGYGYASMLGFMKTVEKESSRFDYKLIDFDGQDAPSQLALLLDERFAPRSTDAVAYRGLRRYEQVVEQVNPADNPGPPAWRQGGTYLLIGGAGGLGLKMAEFMARQVRANLVLVGRSPLSSAKEQAINTLRSHGSEVLYLTGDVADPKRLKDIIANAHGRFGAINGVVHAGGALDDKMLAGADWESFERVMSSKVSGTWRLSELTRGEPLDFFVTFSSIVSVMGNIGQSAYGAANAFMDSMMHHRTAAGYPGKSVSINWTLWSDGGMGTNDAVIKAFSKTGGVISGPVGVAAFAAILDTNLPQCVVAGRREAFGKQVASSVPRITPAAVAAATAPASGPGLTQQLRTILGGVLGIGEDELDDSTDIREFGMDSISLTDFAERVNDKIGGDFNSALLFEYSTLEAVAGYLEGQGLGSASAAPTAAAPAAGLVPRLKAILGEVLGIGEDELDEGTDIREFGMDSISLTDFAERINDKIGGDFNSALLFEYSTLEAINGFLISAGVAGSAAPAAPAPGAPGAIRISMPTQPVQAAATPAPATSSAPPAPVAVGGGSHLTKLKALLSDVLGIGVDELDEGTDIREFGMDSISLTDFAEKVNDKIGGDFNSALLFEYSTLDDINGYLIGAGVSAPGVGSVPAAAASGGSHLTKLKALLSDVLGIGVDELDEGTDIREFGMDSISLTDFAEKVNDKIGGDFNSALLFEYSTLDDINGYLIGAGVPAASAATAPAPVMAAPVVADDAPLFGEEDDNTPLFGEAPAPPQAAASRVPQLRSILSEILGIGEDELDESTDIREFGMDSISLTDFAEKVNDKIGGDFNSALLFEYPTLESVDGYLATAVPMAAAPPAPRAASPAAPRVGGGKPSSLDWSAQSTGNMVSLFEPTPAAERTFDHEKTFDIEPFTGTFTTTDVLGTQDEEQEGAAQVTMPEIAVVGRAGRFPGSPDLDSFWQNLMSNKDLVSEIPSDRWDWQAYLGDPKSPENKTISKWSGFMGDISHFDAGFFNISPREAELMDPQQRWVLEHSWAAVENAGHAPGSLCGSQTGVFIGVCNTDYDELLLRRGVKLDAYTSTGSYFSIIPNRVSYFMDLKGPSVAIDTACSSSLIAIHQAVQAIQLGDCDMALAGGVNICLTPRRYCSFSDAGMLSPDGRCKTFDKSANGYVRGEGVGMIFMKTLEAAKADGDHIYALVKGTAANHGGLANSLTAPNPNAQADLLETAWGRAGVTPDSITFLEAHGTGTPLGDPIEINGMKKAFANMYKKAGLSTPNRPRTAIGTVKTSIGHLESAAGIAGVLKVLLAMEHGSLPGNIHFNELNPYINLDNTPFYIQNSSQPWPMKADADNNPVPRRAGVSSFGFGGANAHIAMESYIAHHEVTPTVGPELIVLSAKDLDRLRDYARDMADFLEKKEALKGVGFRYTLPDVAFTLRNGRDAMSERMAFVAKSLSDVIETMRHFADNPGATGGVLTGKVNLKKAKTNTSIDGHSADEAVEVMANLGELAGIAKHWIDGVQFNWAALDKASAAIRVSLPTYPFAKHRHWVPEGAGVTTFGSAGVAALHPLLDANDSTLYEQRFTKEMTGSEFFLTDHRVGKDKVFPGVGYLEMARAAGELADRSARVARIRNILWSAPISVDGEAVATRIALFPEKKGIEFEVQTGSEETPVVHSSGMLTLVDRDAESKAGAVVNLDAVRGRCEIYKDAAACYQLFSSRGLNYGPAFQGITELRHNKVESLARLQAPGAVKSSFRDFHLHPSLMDGALQAVLPLLDVEPGSTYLPFALSEVVVNGILPEACYAHARLTSSGRVTKFDIRMTDDTGQVIIEMKDFTMRALRDGAAKPTPAPATPKPAATPVAAPAGGDLQSGTLAFITGIVADELRSDAASLNPEKDMEEYGIDSVMISNLTTALEKHFGELSKTLFFEYRTLAELAEFFHEEFTDKLTGLVGAGKAPAAAPSPAPAVTPAPATSGGDLTDKTVKWLSGVVADELRTDAGSLNPDKDMEEYGIDSVMISNLTAALEKHFGELSKTLFFEYRTLGELAEYFAEEFRDKLNSQLGSAPAAETTPAPAAPVKAAKPAAKRARRARFLSADAQSAEDIAIIGMSGRFPKAADVHQFWDNLKAGMDCVIEIPGDRWDHAPYYDANPAAAGKAPSKWGGFMDDVDKFDPLFFNISPREAELMDPQERLFLECAHETVEDAGYKRSDLTGKQIGVFAGIMWSHYQHLGAEEVLKGNNVAPGCVYAYIANRVSFYFDWHGPSISLDTMCSSSLVAIHLAGDSIRRGESQMAIAGGVNLTLHQNKYLHLSQSNFLAHDGRCRAFGEGGTGYVPGEGVGTVLLKAVSQAEADNDHIYGVIKGTSSNHGGKTNGITVPNPIAQSQLIVSALKNADIEPNTIGYVEAHGTGTSLGDPIEINGLTRAYKEWGFDPRSIAIGSVKSNIGHLESASAIASVIKVLLQLKHKQLVPSLTHAEQLNSKINFKDSPFTVQQSIADWSVREIEVDGVAETHPRRAAISSFGAGGSNGHLIIEEYGEERPGVEFDGPKLFLLSARDEDRLRAYAQRVADFLALEHTATPSLSDMAYTSQVGRESMQYRLAVEVESAADLQAALTDFATGKSRSNLHSGNAKRKDGQSGLLLDGREGQMFINILVEDRKFGKLGQLWVTGVDVDWTLLYGGELPNRVSMPTYPFERERYWLERVEGGPVGAASWLHPLLERNTSTLNGQAFQSTFDANEFFLADHVVNGAMLLPGAAYLEMARAAGHIGAEMPVIRMRDVVWQRPVVAKSGESAAVTLTLEPSDYYVGFQIKQGEAVNSHGMLYFDGGEQRLAVDLEGMRSRCTQPWDKDTCYTTFASMGFQYGPRFQPISELTVGPGEVCAKLELPQELRAGADAFGLHPSLVDGAFQSVIPLVYDPNGPIFLPHSLGEVEIFAPLPERVWVTVSALGGSDPNSRAFDIYITDDTGLVLVKLAHFSVRAGLGGPAKGSATGDVGEEAAV